MKVKANPFVITFHDGADGRPEHVLHLLEHVLHLLVGYRVTLRKNGKVVCEGNVDLVDGNLVYISEFCDHCGRVNDKEPKQFDMTIHFDEVMYL